MTNPPIGLIPAAVFLASLGLLPAEAQPTTTLNLTATTPIVVAPSGAGNQARVISCPSCDTSAPEWQAGSVAAIGTGLTLATGTLAATAAAAQWTAGTVATVGSGLAVVSGTLAATAAAAQWTAGTVASVGSGLAVVSGTLAATAAAPQWTAGTVTALGAGLAVNTGTIAAQWTAGAASVVGTGLSLVAGTLTATSSGSVSSIVAGTGLGGGTITTAGTITLGSIAFGDFLANYGSNPAIPIATSITQGVGKACGTGQFIYGSAGGSGACTNGGTIGAWMQQANPGGNQTPVWTNLYSFEHLKCDQTGFAVLAGDGCYSHMTQAGTLEGLIVSGLSLSCTSNPVWTIVNCGTSVTCAVPTSMASGTITAVGTAFVGTVTSAPFVAGSYLAFTLAGTCTALTVTASAELAHQD